MWRLACVLGLLGCGGGAAGVDGALTVDLAHSLIDASAPDLATPPSYTVYVSGYSTTIAQWTFDPTTGALSDEQDTTATGTPSFMAFDAALSHVYATDEANSVVEAFSVDATSGALTHIGTDRSSGGSGPAFVSIDPSGKWVLAANYGGGTVGILPIASDGTLAAGASIKPGTMAHQAIVDPTDQHAWVPCLGSDYVAQYSFDAATGALAALPGTAATVSFPAKAGPRHLALHPTKALAYVVEETDSMVGAYSVTSGQLTVLARVSTRATGATATNTAAEVAVHPSAKWVYVSNRGDDDLGVFAIGSDGTLTAVDHTKSGGTTPRHFAIDPTGRWLVAANQGSGDVHVFAIDQATGKLTDTNAPVAATMPSFVGIVAR